MSAPISISMDTSGLRRVIPELVAYGRRTITEQCVTSMWMILQDTQNFGDNPIPFVDVERMDQELDAPADVKYSHTNSSGKKTDGTHQPGISEGEMIVVARMHANSEYSRLTGNRWPVVMPDFGSRRDAGSAFWGFVIQVLERMRAARHSSGHFIQSGFKGPIEKCVTSPLFKNKYRARTAMAPANPLNKMDAGELGKLEMTPVESPEFQITAENNVGEEGDNVVLNEKHREARDAYAAGPLQDSINKESAACQTELERRVAEKWPVFNRLLS